MLAGIFVVTVVLAAAYIILRANRSVQYETLIWQSLDGEYRLGSFAFQRASIRVALFLCRDTLRAWIAEQNHVKPFRKLCLYSSRAEDAPPRAAWPDDVRVYSLDAFCSILDRFDDVYLTQSGMYLRPGAFFRNLIRDEEIQGPNTCIPVLPTHVADPPLSGVRILSWRDCDREDAAGVQEYRDKKRNVGLSLAEVQRLGPDDKTDIDPCVVCMDQSRRVALLPCSHAHVCNQCVVKMVQRTAHPTCPTCRSPVHSILPIFR